MNIFDALKQNVTNSMERLRKDAGSDEIALAVNTSGDWDTLETRLFELRTVSRKRQKEILDRLEPIAVRIEQVMEEAKNARFKVKRDTLLRQADDLMRDLESEEEPAKVYGANGQMLTKLIMQVRRARAIEQRGVSSETVDLISVNLENLVVQYQDVFDATTACDVELELDGEPVQAKASQIEKRLGALLVTALDDDATPCRTGSNNVQTPLLEERLYESE